MLYLFFLLVTLLHAEKINIICYKNGVGLSQDRQILEEELTKLGHLVRHIDYRDTRLPPRADINLFVEVANNFFFSYADKNIFIPNAECYSFPTEWIPQFDQILCKTQEAVRIFRRLNPRTTFLSFTSKDRYDPSVPKDFTQAFHLAGASVHKSTDLVIDTWMNNLHLPPLLIIRHRWGSQVPPMPHLEQVYRYLSDKELKQVQNSRGLHICPSDTEGFGHYIVEAMSCGAVVVTTDAPPMHEMIPEKKCLVASMRSEPCRLATRYFPDSTQLIKTVENLSTLSAEELAAIGQKNRAWYLKNDQFFKQRMAEIFKPQAHKWVLTDFVWNLGMAASCDFGPNRDPIYHFRLQETGCPYRTNTMKPGDILWLRCTQIPRFIQETLPQLNVPVVLLINDGDESFPRCPSLTIDIEPLLKSPKIIHIFAQNGNAFGPKISPIPIGIDFHTLAYKPKARLFWGPQATPLEQEAELKALIQILKPTNQRKPRAFVDFHHCDSMRGTCQRSREFGEDRTTIFRRLLATGLIDHGELMPRKELWKKKGEYAFSISPIGNGYDCHRTWEDLALGCIVIVKSSPIDSLYQGLPVVIVKDWAEVNESNLQKWLHQYGDALTNPAYREKLTNRYWLAKVRAAAQTYRGTE